MQLVPQADRDASALPHAYRFDLNEGARTITVYSPSGCKLNTYKMQAGWDLAGFRSRFFDPFYHLGHLVVESC